MKLQLQLIASTAAVLFSASPGSVSATSLRGRGVAITSDVETADSSDYYYYPEVEDYDFDSADYYPKSEEDYDFDYDYEDDEEEEDPDDVGHLNEARFVDNPRKNGLQFPVGRNRNHKRISRDHDPTDPNCKFNCNAIPQKTHYEASCGFNSKGKWVCNESRKKTRPNRHANFD